jgi:hypothetical protein
VQLIRQFFLTYLFRDPLKNLALLTTDAYSLLHRHPSLDVLTHINLQDEVVSFTCSPPPGGPPAVFRLVPTLHLSSVSGSTRNLWPRQHSSPGDQGKQTIPTQSSNWGLGILSSPNQNLEIIREYRTILFHIMLCWCKSGSAGKTWINDAWEQRYKVE